MNGTVSVEGLSWANVIAPLIVAVLVGVASSYITTRVQIGRIQQRVKLVEEELTRVRSKGKVRTKNTREMRERVIRMETKIDLLLQSQGLSAEDLTDTE